MKKTRKTSCGKAKASDDFGGRGAGRAIPLTLFCLGFFCGGGGGGGGAPDDMNNV